jgi:hypothetical protein
MPKGMVEPAAMKCSALGPTAMETMEPAAVKCSTPPPAKSPAATVAIRGIGHLWLNNGGSKQQCC